MALAVFAGPGAAGCLFLEEVNSPPQAQIETADPGPYYREAPIAIRADKSTDPDGTLKTVNWRAFTCSADRTACDAPPLLEQTGAPIDARFVVTPPSRRPGNDPNDPDELGEPLRIIAVEAEVFDDRGASHRDRVFIDLTNREPDVDLQAQGVTTSGITGLDGFPVSAPVYIVAQGSDLDGDPLDFQWTLLPPPGSTPGDVQFYELESGPQSAIYVLIPDIPGTWRVEVTASDEPGDAEDTHVDVVIEADHPPCIRTLDPPYAEGARYIIDRDGPARRFAVLHALDDLDSYPRRRGDELTDPYFDSARFRWQIASPDTSGQFIELSGHDLADYLFDAAAFVPGDQLSLRVEARDRVDRTLGCDDQQPTCALVSACTQRFTWDVEVR